MSVAVGVVLGACGNDHEHGGLVVSVSGNQPGGSCTGSGCACSSEGASVACGETESKKGDDLVCALGTRTCMGGVWSACSVTRHMTKYAPAQGLHLLNLATAPTPCGDPCDPTCSVFFDTPPGLDPGPDFTVKGGTLTLPARAGGGSCADLALTPSRGTITVTSLTPLVTDPPTLSFSATCRAGGEPIEPSWVLAASDSDVARIDANGVLRVVAGRAKTVQVTAATALGRATASVDVRILVDQVDAGCEAEADVFTMPSVGVDPGQTLYPYAVPARPVVFPLGFTGPLVQWTTGGVNANCVKLSLDFPRGVASPSFHWSRLYSRAGLSDAKIVDVTQPAAPIPDDVWAAFSRAAAGQLADIVVQRLPLGAPAALAPLPAIPVKFAADSIRGTAFFTQYLRRFRDDQNSADVNICGDAEYGQQPDLDIGDARFHTSAASGCVDDDCAANSAPACPVGNCTQAVTFRSQVATLEALDLANPTQGLSEPFGAGTNTRCVACHSISADGRTLVASDYGSSGLQTIAQLDALDGRARANPTADAPSYSWSSGRGESVEPEREQSKGLSFAALTPDGRYALSGPNFWGNTNFYFPLGSGNTQDAAYSAGGKRYFLLDVKRYRRNVQLATAAALPAHTVSNGVLVGAVNEALNVDGSGVVAGDAVLVKDEPDARENGVYTVEVSSPTRRFRLARRLTESGAEPLAFGDKFRVERGNTNAGKYFHLAAPSTGTILLGSSELTFALYDTVMAATSRALPPHRAELGDDDQPLLTGDGRFQPSYIDDVPTDYHMSILVKDEVGANAVQNGIYELDDAEASPWVLRRRSEANLDPELVPGARVRVNQGTRNGGKTFVLDGAKGLKIGTSALTFVADERLDEGTKYNNAGTPSTLPTMMFPSFAPDGSSLVYVNGDADTVGTGAAATGWRRGLSLLSFDASNIAQPFASKRRVLNTFGAARLGDVLKWPFFEHDSRSVIYQASSVDEFCPMEAYQGQCTGPDCAASSEAIAIDSDLERACFKWSGSTEYGHGNGAPTARGYWPGRLESVSTTSSQRAELRNLNLGLAAQDSALFEADASKSYQPNVLPFAAGGYRWVVFTSTRAYGNQLNAVGTHFSCATPLLWMAALDDTTAGSADRSYPAFLLPGQNLRSILATATQAPYGRHFMNERGYVVPSACKGEHAACAADADCCAGNGPTPALSCRLNTATDPPSRSCEAASACRATGDACAEGADCCSGLCLEQTCSTSPTFSRALYTRVFSSNCPSNYKVRWGNFEWHAEAPSSTHIDFHVSVSDSAYEFSGGILLGRADSENINVPPAELQRVDVGAALEAAEIASAPFLRVTMVFFPSEDGSTAPALYDWDQRFDCLAAE